MNVYVNSRSFDNYIDNQKANEDPEEGRRITAYWYDCDSCNRIFKTRSQEPPKECPMCKGKVRSENGR